MRSVFQSKKVTKCVVLVGGPRHSLIPLAKFKQVSAISVMNKPLIDHTINFLKDRGVTDIIIAGSRGSRDIGYYKKFLGNGRNGSLNVRYFEDERPRGTAGVLRDHREQFKNEPFLAISGKCFPGDIDLDGLLAFHDKKKAALTMVVKRTRQFLPEALHCTSDGMIEDFVRLHSSSERSSSLEAVGIYVFSPAALDHIHNDAYFDIKEQLVSALRSASLPVYAYETQKFCKTLNTVKDYYDLHRAILYNNNRFPPQDMTMIADGVWVGSDVSISPQAYIIGPVVIGNNSIIERNTQIIGPSVIGERCMIEEGAILRESILWDDSVIESGSQVQHCIVEQGLRATARQSFFNTIMVEDAEPEDAGVMASDQAFRGITAMNPSFLNSQKRKLYILTKRLMDISCSVLGLIIISPLLSAVALMIKADSPGPVFFRQKRCGKSGKDFGMFKFRTMVQDADKQQKKLEARKKMVGPVFKCVDDPRITRVGAFLRKTSLDELPQLINVLKGEMSLVGPRPLVMNEMKCSASWRDIRLRVKPGMTGLWQVSGRAGEHFHDWIRYDVHYVMNQSIWMDLKILFRTINVVLKKTGAY